MAEGRRSDTWDHTSALLATIARVGGNKDARPEMFHPMRKAPPPARIKPSEVSHLFRTGAK